MSRRKLYAAAAIVSLALGPIATAACSAAPGRPREITAGAAAAGRRPAPPAQVPAGELRVPILMYHHVGPVAGTWKQLYVGLPSFARQMREIASSGVATPTIGELYDAARSGRSFPAGAVAITFDDATADQYDLAFPVLRQYRIRSTLFVPAGLVGKPGYLTWDQLREMRDSGLVEIQSHTLTHADLVKLDSRAAAREIAESRAMLERKLRVRVRHFAYPYGSYNEEIVSLVRSAGYLSSVTNRYRLGHDPQRTFEWGRMAVHDRYAPANLVSLALSSGSWRA